MVLALALLPNESDDAGSVRKACSSQHNSSQQESSRRCCKVAEKKQQRQGKQLPSPKRRLHQSRSMMIFNFAI